MAEEIKHELKISVRPSDNDDDILLVIATDHDGREALMATLTRGLVDDPVLEQKFRNFVMAIGESLVARVDGTVDSIQIVEGKPPTSN